MSSKKLLILADRLRRESKGQDLIEYALLAGFVAVAAGASLGNIVFPSVNAIYRGIETVLVAASSIG